MNDAREWVSSRLTVCSTAGDEVVCLCPWCGKDKLWVNTKKQRFICYYGCRAGSLVSLVAEVEKVSFKDAAALIEVAGPRTTGELRDLFDNLREPAVDVERVRQHLPPEFIPCFDGRTFNVPVYVDDDLPEGRGLDDATIIRHGLGWAKEGRYRDRLIVPIHCEGNYTFLGRLMGRPRDFRWTTEEGATVEPPRYLHPKGANISTFLYWFDHLPEDVDVVLVEGVFDAIRLLSFGIYAVATFGKRVTRAQVALLRRRRPRSVTVFYDAGAVAEGHEDSSLLKSRLRIPVRRCTPPGLHDPDSLGFAEGASAVRACLAAAEDAGTRLDGLAEALKGLRPRGD